MSWFSRRKENPDNAERIARRKEQLAISIMYLNDKLRGRQVGDIHIPPETKQRIVIQEELEKRREELQNLRRN
jgi:hypothetical protein